MAKKKETRFEVKYFLIEPDETITIERVVKNHDDLSDKIFHDYIIESDVFPSRLGTVIAITEKESHFVGNHRINKIVVTEIE